MSSLVLPLFFVLIAWWLGTATVLVLQQQYRTSHGVTSWLLPAIALISAVTLFSTSTSASISAHFLAFLAALVLWGCIELSYYWGLITGTHKQPCPADIVGWPRFRIAIQTSIWHETTAMVTGLLLLVILWEAHNPTGLYAFLVLWLMRWSAKLNLFIGVPHFSTAWFPESMNYLKSYIQHRPISLFFLISVGLATGVALWLLETASSVGGTSALSYRLPALLLCLAIVEHIFMALPIADNKLWNGLFQTNIPKAMDSVAKSNNGERS